MDEGLLVEYDPSTMSKCLFYSHTWLRFAHPDSADGVKKKLIHELSKGIVEGTVAFHAYWFAVVAHQMKDLPAQDVTAKYKDCHVWLDYISIPQRDRGAQGLAIQAAEERHAAILEHLAASAVALNAALTGDPAHRHPVVAGGDRDQLVATLHTAVRVAGSRLRGEA